MLLFCIEVYLVLAIPALVIIWTALIAAKHGDEERTKDDFERDISSRIEFMDTVY